MDVAPNLKRQAVSEADSQSTAPGETWVVILRSAAHRTLQMRREHGDLWTARVDDDCVCR